jgi:diguanylate cyclase (GGDEF)-like protein/putative nucleotidyltransferase with HDIG domain
MLFALSILEMTHLRVSSYWLVLASVAAVTSALAIKIPEIDSRISIEDTLVFSNLVLFGVQAGVITAALQGLMGSIRAKSLSKRAEFVLFNAGALVLSAYLSGHTFFYLLGKGPLLAERTISLRELAVPIAALALVHYLSNSSTVAIVIALDLRKNIYEIWMKSFRWACLSYFAAASVAALAAVSLKSGSLAGLGALIPVMLVIYFAYKTYKEKLEEQRKSYKDLTSLYLRTVESLALAVDAKDQSTYGHVRRVRAYALGLSRLCNITNDNELMAIDTGALLHDIGKLAVDDYILNKPGQLNKREFDAMKIHAVAGEEILEQVRFPYPVAKIVRAHHERWDGKGYPDGLKGEEIPLGARILILADTFDAIHSPRPYKRAHGLQECIEELRNGIGSVYDPKLAELFLVNIDRLKAEADEAVKNMPKLSYRSASAEPSADAEVVDPYESIPALPQSLKCSAELVSLCEFCAGLARQLSLPDFLVNLECRLRRLLPFTSWVCLLDNGNNKLNAAHAGGKFADVLRRIQIEVGMGISGWAAAYQRSALNASAALEFDQHQSELSSLSNALVAPVIKGGVCSGTISLYAEPPITYSDDHLEILQFVANQVAPLLAEIPQSTTSFSENFLDPVTKAYRASYLALAGREMILSCQNSSSHLCLIYLNIRNFQDIVELLGTHAGDSAICKAADTLKSEVRENDILVRFGQQGFVLLLAALPKNQIQRRVRQIIRRLSEVGNGNMLAIECQAGAASYPEDGNTVFDLLDAARRALERDACLQSQDALQNQKVLNFQAAG